MKDSKTTPKMILCDNVIIKVQQETKDKYIGFDIFSENAIYIYKENKNAIELPKVVMALINCEVARFQLAYSLGDTQADVAKILGLSERSLNRFNNRHSLFDFDEKIKDMKKRTSDTMKNKHLKKQKNENQKK